MRKKKESVRTKPLQSEPDRIATLERVLARHAERRFVVRSKQYPSGQPERVVCLNDADKLHRELGFPHGHKVVRFLQQYPLLFQTLPAISGETVLLGLSGELRKTRPKTEAALAEAAGGGEGVGGATEGGVGAAVGAVAAE